MLNEVAQPPKRRQLRAIRMLGEHINQAANAAQVPKPRDCQLQKAAIAAE
jgi:hypothetical protein